MKHTPFDGSQPLFRLGLEPLDLCDWIEVDDHLEFYLNEKHRLTKLYGDKLFVAEEGTRKAQLEALEMIASHITTQFPEIYHSLHDGRVIDIPCAKATVEIDDKDVAPLMLASWLVQEDLILMRKGEDGWRLAAASLCFPSSWSLREKFSKPLGQIHAPVPGFETGSRNDIVINRIFDNLNPEQPVRRLNWSIYSDDELFHDDRAAEHLRKQDFENGIFLRVEHQTLRKLPLSGYILFTVRIHIDPLEQLAAHPNGSDICNGAITLLQKLDAAQLAYKGLTNERDRLIVRLREMAEGKAHS